MSQSGPGLQADFSLEEATEDQEVRAAVRATPSSLLLDAHFCAKVRLHEMMMRERCSRCKRR